MLITGRLRLRPWEYSDLDDLLMLNQAPEVNRWLGGETLTKDSVAALARYRAQYIVQGYGVLHVSDQAGNFYGLAGLQPVHEELPVWPATEAIWRLLPEVRGQGHATKAMKSILAALPHVPKEIIAVIALSNLPSARVAQRLGFCNDVAADFLYPGILPDPTLRPHRVYRLRYGNPPGK